MFKLFMISVVTCGIGAHLSNLDMRLSQHFGSHAPVVNVQQSSVDKIGAAIGASPRQVKEMASLQTQYFQSKHKLAHAIFDEESKQEAAPKLKALRASSEAALKKILPADRFQKMQVQGRMSAFFGDSAPSSPLEVLEKLNLAPAQLEEVKRIHARVLGVNQQIQQNTSLTPAQAMQQQKESHEQAIHEVMAILTPEQRAQLHGMMQSFHQMEGDHVSPNHKP
jgi:hypothetical protein